jgi:hypothetical protein
MVQMRYLTLNVPLVLKEIGKGKLSNIVLNVKDIVAKVVSRFIRIFQL